MILDTNALSAFADGVPPVLQQIAAADELHIPVIVLGEYRFGIATSRRRREYKAGCCVAIHFGTCYLSSKRPQRIMRPFGSN